MRVYEIRVERVTIEGRWDGYEVIGYAIDKDKAEKYAKTWAKRHERNEWWCAYGKNREGHINVEVVDKGKVIE